MNNVRSDEIKIFAAVKGISNWNYIDGKIILSKLPNNYIRLKNANNHRY